MPSEYRLPNMGGPTISTKITVQLMHELRDGLFKESERLPSEMELAEHYKVSRSVIRDVLADLEREGYVERGRGVGTVINREIVKLNNRLDLKFEYNNLIRGAGAVPSSDSVRLYMKGADEELAEKLNVDVGCPLIVCEKRLLASGRPVVYSIDHVPEFMFSGADWRAMDWGSPVFDLLEDAGGILVDTSVTWLSATLGPENIRQKLEVEKDEALILLEEIGYYKLSRPIIHSYGFYTNYFDFTMLRKKF